MMKNETKQDVFDDALKALEEFGEQGSSWEMAYDGLSARYASAIKDDLPVIPKNIAEYIENMKSSHRDIWEATHYWLRTPDIDEYMEDNPEVFARAWLDGYVVEDHD